MRSTTRTTKLDAKIKHFLAQKTAQHPDLGNPVDDILHELEYDQRHDPITSHQIPRQRSFGISFKRSQYA